MQSGEVACSRLRTWQMTESGLDPREHVLQTPSSPDGPQSSSNSSPLDCGSAFPSIWWGWPAGIHPHIWASPAHHTLPLSISRCCESLWGPIILGPGQMLYLFFLQILADHLLWDRWCGRLNNGTSKMLPSWSQILRICFPAQWKGFCRCD